MKDAIKTGTMCRKTRTIDLKAAIVKFLGWTEMEYAEMQYEHGLLYLTTYLEQDTAYANLLSGCKIYWSWWKNHWANRDQDFLRMMETVDAPLELRRILYSDYHDGAKLAEMIHPNSVVLNESYTEMIGAVIVSEKKKEVSHG